MRTLTLCVAACVLLLDGRAAALHAPVGGALIPQTRPVGTQGHGPQHNPALSLRGGAEGSKDQIQVRTAHCPGTGAGHNTSMLWSSDLEVSMV